jgi:hypothetical protein
MTNSQALENMAMDSVKVRQMVSYHALHISLLCLFMEKVLTRFAGNDPLILARQMASVGIALVSALAMATSVCTIMTESAVFSAFYSAHL